MELLQRVAAQVHQRRHPQVQCQPDHPQVGYGHHQHDQTAIEAAYKEGEAKLKGNGRTVPALSVLKTPLRDGDAERPDDEAYANAYFVNANRATAPGIVDADRQPIL